MGNIIVAELTKLVSFGLIVIAIVFSFQLKYEYQANQFVLDEHAPLVHHNKRYEKLRLDGTHKPVCPLYPSSLTGINELDINALPTWSQLESTLGKHLEPGGFYDPPDCVQREKLAVIIPYRDRESNLLLLLKHLHPLLQRQSRYYRVFLVEQYGVDTFNKGRIMNIGAREAAKHDDFDCFVFHDVDLIPENDRNVYECFKEPRHLCPAVDELRYNLMYFNLVGGVLALSAEQLRRTNGYSNLYWGWGAEDDDMSMRVIDAGYKITRPTNKVGRYKMILHGKRERATNRFELLDYWKRYPSDGISSLNELNFTVIVNDSTRSPLFTNITIDVGQAPPAHDQNSFEESMKVIEKKKFSFH